MNQVQSLHAKIIRKGQEHDPFIVFELIRVCSNFNSIDHASKVFQHAQNPNVYLHTALIDGFVLSGSYVDAIRLFCEMVYESVIPDAYAITSVLKACGSQLALEEGKQVHGQALKLGLSSNRLIRMKLMELYGKCGEFEDAQQVYAEMPEGDVVASTVMITCYLDYKFINEAIGVFNRVLVRDTVCWTAMIDGFVRNGEFNRALELFREMQEDDVRPNEVTVVCVLSACSQLGALELGRWLHFYIEKYGIKLNHVVGGALISMYSRCGDIDEAWRVFDGLKERDVTTYNSMISGLAMHGKSIEAIEMFRGMMKQGIRPNNITFIGVLNACSHGVDCGHADSSTYILLSNVYALSGRWKEAAKVRAKMEESGMLKEPGCSSIEVNNEIHEFLLGDIRHPQREVIYKKLKDLNRVLKLEGYLPSTEMVLHDMEDEQKEWALAIHSERLALSYGLISTTPHTTLRIVKNLRVCNDCHSMIKLLSKITRRKIVVRDRNRFHHFENGACSCGDYW
ncbi:hypothetical protein FH972_010671 [Carpinus fangiana]|uniref:DYW domain-containing protein n=1 Tax=Carpinus fangiana TaxID=176857 RepID=A0A660KV08_9ROSI|nr:hypothetical protein FH972_010671 [Carpinus fangiana]